MVELAGLWTSIVHDFTSRALLVTEDRLPAIAGIASEIQNVWEHDYYAGMWGHCLI
jgi:hypothetical protein